MAAASPEPSRPDVARALPPDASSTRVPAPSSRRARALEAKGILLIGALVLLLTLVRYWHSIPWGAR